MWRYTCTIIKRVTLINPCWKFSIVYKTHTCPNDSSQAIIFQLLLLAQFGVKWKGTSLTIWAPALYTVPSVSRKDPITSPSLLEKPVSVAFPSNTLLPSDDCQRKTRIRFRWEEHDQSGRKIMKHFLVSSPNFNHS